MGMTILGVTNKSWYLHFLLNLAVMLFNVGRETKTYLTQGQCKPRNEGMDVLPNSPASSLLYSQSKPSLEQVESWHYRVSGGKCGDTVCSLARSKILGYVPGLQGGHQRHALAFCSPFPSLHAFFFSPATSSKRFFLPPRDTFLPTPNGQTPFSGLQMHEEHQLCFQTFQCLKIRTVSLQILILFAVTLKNYCLNILFSISYPPSTFT